MIDNVYTDKEQNRGNRKILAPACRMVATRKLMINSKYYHHTDNYVPN